MKKFLLLLLISITLSAATQDAQNDNTLQPMIQQLTGG